ncbi:hypothetical protein SAMN05660206_11331 [Sphingobacterium wenxiniae]|uniref:Uncharacterized protein n=1 Tax=Sphingobacterium wenxiniae TaxID=683125 RepID=A0A1I6VE28_9SPHI|nr:hypothetical protein SAMN05660206_11331 [Sphingobacterium wenxiniae]
MNKYFEKAKIRSVIDNTQLYKNTNIKTYLILKIQ